MKLWKKVILAMLGVVLVSQLPFAYRRYRLGRLHSVIAQLNSERAANHTGDVYTDYKGVIHVHSMLGGHSTGTFAEIIKSANDNGLNFIIMTEHPSEYIDTAEMTLKGVHKGVLFINGSEVSTAGKDRLLLVPGNALANAAASTPTQEVITQEKAQGGLAFVAYPQEFRSWDAGDYTGIEVYNLYTNARRINPLVAFFDGLWSYWSYPDLLFATFYERPGENLKKWDEMMATKGRKLVAIAGNDAHSNIGVSLEDATGRKLLGIKLDPYERSFHIVRTHVLIDKERPLSAEALLQALANGHGFISFDLFCDGTNFTFTAENGTEKKIVGDEIGLHNGVRLNVTTPVRSRIVLIKDGAAVQEGDETTSQEFLVNQTGVYRIEAYLPQLQNPLRDKPWIISNPIYVR